MSRALDRGRAEAELTSSLLAFVVVLPGTGKTFEQFTADDSACRRWASEQEGSGDQWRYDMAYIQYVRQGPPRAGARWRLGVRGAEVGAGGHPSGGHAAPAPGQAAGPATRAVAVARTRRAS